jgi:catechol 2,3-dioxygenase-like lactoylglutathione lyase family enzyme
MPVLASTGLESRMPIPVVAIDHVQIAVPRALEAETLSFYRTVLGLTEIEKPAELKARGGAWFQIGAIQLHIGVEPRASPKGKRHICFLVTNLDRARAELATSGVMIEEGSAAVGLKRFFVCDPAGNRIEMVQS